VICDHVWFGDGLRVRNVTGIGSRSIVGAGSNVIARSIPENVIAVGAPASVVKCGVAWAQEPIETSPDMGEDK
jgi:acetyltransferase-like isoleucine patch superfamily enzyme